MVNEISGKTLNPEGGKQKRSSRWAFVLVWALIGLLLWWALRQAPVEQIVQTLRRLHVWQLAALVGVNLLIYGAMALRWQIVMGGLAHPERPHRVRFAELFALRLSSFGVNYFTPGPMGGEPLMVFLLARRHKLETPTAISSVFLDRLLEVLATFTVVVTGLVLMVMRNMLGNGLQTWALPAAGAVLALPLAHLAALWRGKLPLSAVLARINGGQRWQKVRATAIRAEEQIAVLFSTRPVVLLAGAALSGVIWLILLGEYLLMLQFLQIPLGLVDGMIALTVAHLTFAVPVPGGLGTLEAGQVFAMQMFGLDPVLGLSLSLLMRARDVLFGAAGLFISGWMAKG